jgi:sec-independent protein translocase protein TatA
LDLGPAELFLVLVVVVMLFGGSRIAEIGGSLGKGIKSFRNELSPEDSQKPVATIGPSTVVARTQGESILQTSAKTCEQCSEINLANAKFCSNCGTALF